MDFTATTNPTRDSPTQYSPTRRTLPKLPYLEMPEYIPEPLLPPGPGFATVLFRVALFANLVIASILCIAAIPATTESTISTSTTTSVPAEISVTPEVTVTAVQPAPPVKETPPSQGANLTVTIPDLVSPMDALRAAGGGWINIVRTEDPKLNCGMSAGLGSGGCFQPDTPGNIYVWYGTNTAFEKYVLLHEYAHAVQWKTGGKLNECDADRQAVAWGADPAQAYYLAKC
jgi:hypothetical protein